MCRVQISKYVSCHINVNRVNKTKTNSIDWHLQMKFFNYISLAFFLLLLLLSFSTTFLNFSVCRIIYCYCTNVVWISVSPSVRPIVCLVRCLNFYFVTWWKIRANKIRIKKNLHKLFTWIAHIVHIKRWKLSFFCAEVLIRPHKLY